MGFTGECDWFCAYYYDAPPPGSNNPRPLGIKAGDLRVSAFSRRGSGCHTLVGPPGGHIYERASSRHARHREVYRSSAAGRAVADGAAPLGGGGRGPRGAAAGGRGGPRGGRRAARTRRSRRRTTMPPPRGGTAARDDAGG